MKKQKLSKNEKIILDISKIYCWTGIIVSLIAMIDDGTFLGTLIKFAIVISYLYGNRKLRTIAIIGVLLTLVQTIVNLFTVIDFWSLIDLVGVSSLLYYSFKIDK